MATIGNITKENKELSAIKFAKNCLVLAKETKREKKDGTIENTVTYLEVCELKDTKDITILQNLIKILLAEHRVNKDFSVNYSDTNIKLSRLIRPLLNTNIIYRTNSEGAISKALISEISFNKTGLYLKENHAVCTCENSNLKAAIYKHAKAVLMQCSYITLLSEEVDKIAAACADESAKITRKQKSNTNQIAEPAQPAAA